MKKKESGLTANTLRYYKTDFISRFCFYKTSILQK